jgi:malonyl-CoA/methylmalonyl-CoA synthetase
LIPYRRVLAGILVDADLIIKLMARATVLMGAAFCMRLFIAGSAPLLADTHREWQARTGQAVLERYGMTETNMNTSHPYDDERVPGAVGYPLPGVSVRVTDPETAKALPRETSGMIEVKGSNLLTGYWRMPEKTKAEFPPIVSLSPATSARLTTRAMYTSSTVARIW